MYLLHRIGCIRFLYDEAIGLNRSYEKGININHLIRLGIINVLNSCP